MEVRCATPGDVDRIVDTVTLAFTTDPLWSFAFPESLDQRRQFETWWRLFIESALRYPWIWVTGECEAMALWIPPGGTELTLGEEESFNSWVRDFAPGRADVVLDVVERLDSSHPRDEPHYYLSLLATHPEHRGKGLGMGLLAENLAVIDRESSPAYLESSNQANDVRYARLGFERCGTIDLSSRGGPVVTTMWRPPAGVRPE
jgi:GNAT superfamily N-acetyltransferase